ncbi:MAG: hypothetical protein KDA51_09540 [Planctomycetales bacterium]|nr:hypothetical protein [Planctomycetales bacterium]
MTRQSREYWQDLIALFSTSGLPQEAFCNQHGVRHGTFKNWLYRLRANKSGKPKALVRVKIQEPVSSAPRFFEVSHPNGVVMRFETGADTGYIAALIAAMAP